MDDTERNARAKGCSALHAWEKAGVKRRFLAVARRLRSQRLRACTPEGGRFSFRRAKVTSPSCPRGRLRQRACRAPKLLVYFGEYAASYAWSLWVSTLFFTFFTHPQDLARRAGSNPLDPGAFFFNGPS